MNMDLLKEKKIASLSLGFLVLIFSLVEFCIVYPIIDFERSLRFSNRFDGILSSIRFIFLNLLRNLKIRPLYLCIFALMLLVVTFFISVLVMFILSGINDFINKEETKIRRESLIRVWIIVTLVTLLSIILLLCLSVAILPALLVTSMYIKGNTELVYCVFFDVMTVLAILSFLIYARIPIWKSLNNAVLNRKEKMSDTVFKKLVISFLIFDIIYILTRVITVSFFVNFDGLVIRTLLFIVFMVFNFAYGMIKTYNILDIFSKE